MSNPLVSIIVPVYKVPENLLRQCVESCIKQTYKNLEIILVDDGSPDNCPFICDEFAKIDNRIKVIHKGNGGLSDARNVAIDVMNGEYVTFIDSDDYVTPDYVEHLYSLILQNDILLSCCMDFKYYDGEIPFADKENINTQLLSADEVLMQIFYQKLGTGAPGKLYHKSLFSKIRYPKGYLFEDLATTYRIVQQVEKVAISNYRGYFYYMRPTGIISQPYSPRKFDSCVKICDQLEKDGKAFEKSVRKALSCRITSFLFQIYLQVPKHFEKERSFLRKEIKKRRLRVLLDYKGRRKTRIACFLSLFSFYLVDLFSNRGVSRKF